MQRFLSAGGNTYIARFDGLTTLNNHARIHNDVQLVLAGGISDGGKGYTINKVGGSDLTISGDNTSTWSGGVVVSGGLLLFGTRGSDDLRYAGTTLVPDSISNAGSGDIILNQSFSVQNASTAAIRLNSVGNVAAGQEILIFGSERVYSGRVDLGENAAPSAYNLRSTTNGTLALGLGDGGFYTTALDQSRMGNGKWGVSAYGNTFYMADTLGASIDNVYRFQGANSAALSIVKNKVVTGTASVEVGRSMIHSGFNSPTGTVASIRLYGEQDYTGRTTIFRGSEFGSIGNILEITGSIASTQIDVYGRLTLRGAARATDDQGNQNKTINLMPGSVLRLDYSQDVNDQIVVSRLNNSNLSISNKWGDNTPMTLDGAMLNLIADVQSYSQETIGQLTVKGGASILLERNSTNGGMILTTNGSIIRSGQAMLSIRENADELGLNAFQSQRIYVNSPGWGAANTVNGILAPWMINATRLTFLAYNDLTGMTNAAFTSSGSTPAFLAGLTSTSIGYYNAGANSTLTGVANTYALRIVGTSTLTGGGINIHSGGLISTGNVTFSATTPLYFGNGTTPVEGIIYASDNNTTLLLNGIVTANGLTRSGLGPVRLTNAANAITGTIQLNGGTLTSDVPGALGSASILMHADHQNNTNASQMPIIALQTASANGIYNNPITIAANVPLARIDTNRSSGSGSGTITIPSLTIQGTNSLAGTLLQFQNNNNYVLQVSGETTINGSSDVSLYVSASTAQLMGRVNSSIGFIKTGDGTLRLDADNLSTLSGQVTINRGTLNLQSGSAMGTGNVVVNFGTLVFANATANATFFATADQTLTVNGQTIITLDRAGGGAANKFFGGDNGGQQIITNNSPYLIINGSDTLVSEARLIVNDILSLRTDTTLQMQDAIQGPGRIVKLGNYLTLNNNMQNHFSGGYDAFQGRTLVAQPDATLGTGRVRLFSGTGTSVYDMNTFGPTGLTLFVNSSSAMTNIGVRNVSSLVVVANAIANNNIFRGNGYGILSLDGGQNRAIDPGLQTLEGGFFKEWFLGAGDGGGTLSANSVAPWGTNAAEFRLGGGGSTLTLNPAVAGSDQFADIGVGSPTQMILGAGMNVSAYGFVTFGANGNNSYSGGTLLARSRHYEGGYRGFGLSLQGGAVGTTNTFRTPLGTGAIEAYGEIRVEGASGTAATTGGGNANLWVLHPGSRLRFSNATVFTGSGTTGNLATGTIGGGGRWGDSEGIILNGATLELLGAGSDHIANREVVGDITIMRGASMDVVRAGAFWAELVTGDFTRVGTGTLQLRHNANLLGIGGAANGERIIVANGGDLMNNSMVDPWITSRSQNQFLKYNATTGFQIITEGGAPANYVTSTAATLTVATNNGTQILDVNTNATTLGANLDIYALRTDRDINVSADGNFNRIIIRSGGLLLGSSQTPTIFPDLYFGAAGDGTGEALIWAHANTLQIDGRIFASHVVKSGTAFLNVRSDQQQFTGDWIINGGGIQFLTPNAPSTGAVILNGSRMADNDNVFNLTEVRYNFNSGTPDLFTWTGGKITAYDVNRVYTPTASDRLQQLPAIDLRTTNATPGSGQEGLLFFQVDGFRTTVRTGTVTLYDDYLMHAEAGSYVTGGTTGVQLGSGTGVGGLNNQGLYDFRKVGDLVLILGDNTSSFTGNTTFTVGDGPVRVTHNGAFGAASVNAIINPTASLEIAVSNWVPTANLTQAWGSIERWAVNDARGAGNYTLPDGVHLQVFTDLFGTRTIDLTGGSIMGYLPQDYDQVAVIQTIRSGVTINLTADSFLGQFYPAGGISNSVYYDMGKLNTTTNLNPNDPGLRGSYLQIDGNITGDFNLTKVGQDIIKLSGTGNSYGSTSIENGILQIGANNVLPVAGVLSTWFTGMFDLNGFNQEVAGLAGDGGSINNGGFENNTITVNQNTDTMYGGQINGNVTLVKKGTGELALNGLNSYRGGTVIENGTVIVSQASSLGYNPLSLRMDALVFAGGGLRVNASTTLGSNNGITVGPAGGTISTPNSSTFIVPAPIRGSGDLIKRDDGVLQLNGAGSGFTGASRVVSGTLSGGAENALSPASRVIITGDTVSGTLDLGGFNQTIGSLATTGPSQSAANVQLGANVLTIGGDNTADAVYAGTITGWGGIQIKTHGGQTLSTVDHSIYSWATEVANGRLSLVDNVKLGNGQLTLGVLNVTGADDLIILDLQGVDVTNSIIVEDFNQKGATIIQAITDNGMVSGSIMLNGNIIANVADSKVLTFSGMGDISGNGGITVTGGGTIDLQGGNTYGGFGGGPGPEINGGTIVRSGRVSLSNSNALGFSLVEMGDTRTISTISIDRATTASLTQAAGTYNATGGAAQSGAFTGVSATVDGHIYTAADIGKVILVMSEEANPSRNGVYVITSVTGSTMNLTRHQSFDTPREMTYGTQFTVTNGSSAGKSYFMMGEDSDVCCLPIEGGVRFLEEAAINNVALMLTAADLYVSNSIDVNATIGTGSITLGGDDSFTSGSSYFMGNVVLQDLKSGATGIETKTVTLTSATDGADMGIVFSGAFYEADSINDILSIEKVGLGTVTLDGQSTYRGTTVVAEGTLRMGDSGTIDDTSFIRIDSGATFATSSSGYITDATISGTGLIKGNLTIGSNVGGISSDGVIRVGDSTGGLLENAGDGIGTLTVDGNLSLEGGGVTRLTIQLGSANAADVNFSEQIQAQIGAGTFSSWVGNNSDGHITLWENGSGSHDRLAGSGTLALTAGGHIQISNPDNYNFAHGDVFDLLDWSSINGGSFDVGGNRRAGGLIGDLDLPLLNVGLQWDTSLFLSHGIVIIVPEPARVMLLLLGLLGIGLRRRRRGL